MVASACPSGKRTQTTASTLIECTFSGWAGLTPRMPSTGRNQPQ
jgi:hypothetical protein